MNKKAEPTREELKKFWEWCGFEFGIETSYEKYDDYREHEVFYYPNLRRMRGEQLYHLPSPDLTNLFKYAVPKLDAHTLSKQEGEAEHKASVKFNGRSSGIVYNADPALALFWAIYQVMEADNG